MNIDDNNLPIECDFYYADLQVTITIKEHKGDAFSKLTPNQWAALQQTMYLSLNTFMYVLALHTSDNQIDEGKEDEHREST